METNNVIQLRPKSGDKVKNDVEIKKQWELESVPASIRLKINDFTEDSKGNQYLTICRHPTKVNTYNLHGVKVLPSGEIVYKEASGYQLIHLLNKHGFTITLSRIEEMFNEIHHVGWVD